MNGNLWLQEELEYLCAMWGKERKDRIYNALHRHTPMSISRKARDFALRTRRTSKCSHIAIINKLWEAREKQNLTRSSLGELMGYHPMIIGRYERGETRPSLLKLLDWCEVLGFELTIKRKEPQCI